MSNTLSLSTFENLKQLESDLAKAAERIKGLDLKLAQQVEFNQSQSAVHTKEKEALSQALNSELIELRTELDSFRHKRQIEALEALVGQDSDSQELTKALDKKTAEIRELKKELKELQAFDPKRQKKNLASLKTKGVEQAKIIKDLNSQLRAAKKTTTELKKEVNEANESQFTSQDGEWELYLSKFTFDGEDDSDITRIKALDRVTGSSYLATGKNDDGILWSEARTIPDDVSAAAAVQIKDKKLATERLEK